MSTTTATLEQRLMDIKRNYLLDTAQLRQIVYGNKGK